MDILKLRDLGWLFLRLGWGVLFLLFIAPLSSRGRGKLWDSTAVFACVGGATLIRFLLYPTVFYALLLNLVSYTALCLLLKKTDWRTAFYGTVCFSVMEELTQVISHDLIFNLLLSPRLEALSLTLQNLIHTAVALVIASALVLIFRGWVFRREKSKFSWGQMCLILLPFLVYAYARNLQFVLREASSTLMQPTYQLKIGLLLLLVGFSDLIIAILADHTISAKLQQEELDKMTAILQGQRESYLAQSAASVAVRQKYHDMKNYLLALRVDRENHPTQAQLVGEIEQIMRPLENTLDTGNEFLDVILTEKITICQQKSIKIVPFADGQKIGFIDGLDLCVIVGNALDNAIEAVEGLPEAERIIRLKLCPMRDMLLFTVQNYYRAELRKDERGFYQTTKRDRENHGYGLRGISQAVEKYHGTVSVTTAENDFTLSVLIPFPEEREKPNG